MPVGLTDITVVDVVVLMGLYLVASLLCAGLVVRISATTWPAQILRRRVWSFPIAPVLGAIAALRLALMAMGELADRGVRAIFYAISGKRAFRRTSVNSYGRPRRRRHVRHVRPRSSERTQEVQAGWSRPTR